MTHPTRIRAIHTKITALRKGINDLVKQADNVMGDLHVTQYLGSGAPKKKKKQVEKIAQVSELDPPRKVTGAEPGLSSVTVTRGRIKRPRRTQVWGKL
jgi:hypothetical protein